MKSGASLRSRASSRRSSRWCKSAPPKKVQWKRTNPQTNTVTASGWVVPKSEPYQKPDGTTCREVTQNVSKNGQTQSQDVTLCRTQVAQADGSNWVIPQ